MPLAHKSAAQSIRSPAGKHVAVAKLDSAIRQAMTDTDVPGLSLAVINDGKVVYTGAFGVTNVSSRVPIDSCSLFEAASLSKPVFAYFVLQQVAAGTLGLDEPLYHYLPHPNVAEAYRDSYKKVTARRVLAHRTGFPNHANGRPIKLLFEPGTDFGYSGEAFQYLARVIAHLRETDVVRGLNERIRREVMLPLQMEHTTFVGDEHVAEHLVYGHNAGGLPTRNTPADTLQAYSSLHTEASEYARFLIALLNREGLTPELYAELLAEQTHFADDNLLKVQVGQTGWGLAMAQKPSPYGMMHLHTGNNHDFQSYAMILPEQSFGIVLFMNGPRAIPFIQQLDTFIGPLY